MIVDKKFAKELALDLLKINAVVLRPNQPFTWSSGWNSPIYCDNRLTLRYPKLRQKIAEAFVKVINNKIPNVDVITGTATAGIPHAAWVSDRIDKPMAYVRAKAKSYGLGNQIEGGVDKGQSSVVIEDLISTGTSALTVIDTLQFIGADVKAVLSIFTYGFDKAARQFQEKGIDVYTLTDYATLIEVARENGYVDEKDIELLSDWRKQPETWPN